MSVLTKTIALSGAALLLSATASFAQVGGSDIPSSAKAKAGMSMKGSKMMAKPSMKRGAMMRSGKMRGHKTF